MIPRLAATIAVAAVAAFSSPVSAEVLFGAGVRIGGYDFSHRRYRSVTIRRVKRLSGPPGCRLYPRGTYRRGDGSIVRGPVERCNLPARR